MAEYIAASAAVLMVPSIKGFKQKLEVALSTVDAAVKVAVDLKAGALVKPTAELEAWKDLMEQDGIKVKVDLDTKGLTKSITEIRHKYQDIAADFRKGLALNLKVTGLSLLPQAVSALAAVDQSIVELSQSALLLPGILGGVASAFGTLVVGLHGVKDAFSAFGSAAKDSSQDAKRARDANRSLTDANRDLSRATKDAKRNLEDLNAQMRDAPLDEASAIIELKEAQTELADFWGKSGLQHQKDAIAVEKAESNLANTRTRNLRLFEDGAEANAKGVANSDAVLDALDRQAKAQEAVNTASKGGQAIAEAMNKLSPNAQDFVNKIESMKDSFGGFRDAVQDKLFDGLGDEVVKLGGRLPVVQKGFEGIAGALNGVFKSTLDSVGSDGNVGFLDRIFGNTAGGATNLRAAMDPLISGILRLAAVGSDFLPRLADGFGALMDRFNNFITAADGDGRLEQWMEQGIQAAKDLGNSFLNIGSIMGSVAEAFGAGSEGGFLGALERGTAKLAEFLGSDEGQARMKAFFHDAREQLNQWIPVFKEIAGAIKSAIGVGQDWANALMPFLRIAATLLKDNAWAVQGVLTAYLAWKTVYPVIKGLKALLDGELLGAIKKVVAAVGEGEGFKGKLGALSGFIAGAFTTAAVALAAFIAGSFVQAFQEGSTELANMKTKADELRASLDSVTGAADAASAAAVSMGLQDATNSVTGDKLGDVLSVADDRKLDRGGLVRAAATGDQAKVDEILAPLTKTTTAEVENSEFYRDNKELVDANGGVAMLVGALNGKQDDVTKYNDMINKSARDQLGYNASQDQLRGAERAQLIEMYDLGDFKKDLSPDTQANTNLTGAVTEATTNAVNGGAGIRQTNEDANGKATLKPGNPFGPGATVQVTDNKGIAVFVPGAPNLTLGQNVEANNGTVDPKLNGTQYTLGPERAKLYADLPAFKDGGQYRGPGSGTSDSGMARVSNGEFITRAAQVAKNPALFHGLNSGAIDPRSLPAFEGGGLIDVFNGGASGPYKPKPPAPFAGVSTSGSAPAAAPNSGPGGSALLRAAGEDAAKLTGAKAREDTGLTLPVRGPKLRPEIAGLPGRVWNFFNPPSAFPATSTSAPVSSDHHNVDGWWQALGLPKPPAKSPAPAGPKWIPGKGFVDANGKSVPSPGSTDAQKKIFESSQGGTSSAHTGSGTPPGQSATHAGSGAPAGPVDGSGRVQWPTSVSAFTAPTASTVSVGTPGAPGATPGFAGLPDVLQPATLLGSIGSVLLDAVLGFFGINPEYINALKKGLGLIGKGPDGGVANILDARPGMEGAFDPLTGEQGTFAGPLGPGRANEAGLQKNTIAAERAISAMFPKITEIGGVREDGLKWHPNGLAIDVMIPGGDTANGLNAEGKAYGDQIYAYIMANKDALGVDYVMWQEKDHFNHLHVNTTGGGFPTGNEVYSLPGMQTLPNTPPGTAPAEYVAGAGAEQWRDEVQQAVAQFGPQFGIQNPKAWEDAMVRQLQSESGGDPGAYNGNDSNGQGGSQVVAGIGQFLRSTFDANNVSGGDYMDPRAQIAAMIPYVAGKYGQNAAGGPNFIGEGHGYADGGMLSGPGSGTSDSILARVSNGEFITKASVVEKSPALFHGLNSGAIDPRALSQFAVGGPVGVDTLKPKLPDGKVATKPTAPGPGGLRPAKPAATPGSSLPGVDTSARAGLGAAPVSQDHNLSAVSSGIDGASAAIGNALSTAASAASFGAGAGGGGGGAGALIGGATQIGGDVVKGLVNIGSSLLVGTATPGTTAGAYGSPLLPSKQTAAPQGPQIVNQYGDIHTASYDEFYKGQQRREQQQQAPFISSIGK